MNATAAATSTITWAAVCNDFLGELTGLSHDESCEALIRGLSDEEDMAVIEPHISRLCTLHRSKFAKRVMANFSFSVTIGGNVTDVPTESVEVVRPVLSEMAREASAELYSALWAITPRKS